MQVLKQSFWQFPSDINALNSVLSWFNQYELCIPKKVWLQCQLVLAEWFTNVIRYAHQDLPSQTPIDIEFMLFPDYLEIRIWDFGQPFDLDGYFQNLPKTPNLTSEGGRGIPILYQIADRLTYTRLENNRNCLLFIKYY